MWTTCQFGSSGRAHQHAKRRPREGTLGSGYLHRLRLRTLPTSEQSAHHAAEQRAGSAAAIVTAAASAAGVGGVMHRLVVGGIIGSDAGGDDLGLQRLELQRVDNAALG